jgi:hypothetical protein
VIVLLSIAFVRFMIKNLRLSVGMKNITLAFSFWDDGASFDELMVICLLVYLVTSVRLVIYKLNQKAPPSPSTVRLAGLASVNLCLRWRPSFFLLEVFIKPLTF